MKLCILLTFLCTISPIFGTPILEVSSSRSLSTDLDEFAEYIPTVKVIKIFTEYVILDRDVKDFIRYLKGYEFSQCWDQVFGNQDVKNFINYLQGKGVNVVGGLNKILNFLSLNNYQPTQMDVEGKRTGGLRGLILDVVAVIQYEKMFVLYNEKRVTSPDFKELDEKIRNFNFVEIIKFVHESKELSNFILTLRNAGIDVDFIVDSVASFYGWTKY